METWLERFAQANFRRSADTAHDLKTPLNIAVLNLELLRMRLRKLVGEDEKVIEHAAAIEQELRRMGRIFDAFFLLSTPPQSGDPQSIDAAVIAAEVAEGSAVRLQADGGIPIRAHPDRIREMFRSLFAAAGKAIGGGCQASLRQDGQQITVEIAGSEVAGIEAGKLFKLYYTDPEGNPDLSLAVARLIAETYGGDLTAEEQDGRISFRLSLPLGE